MNDTTNEPKKLKNAKIADIEKELTDLVKTDIHNSKIYELLVKLARIYILQNRFTTGYKDVEAVCHDVASDIYIKLLNGAEIKYWIYYIGKCIKLSYVPKQKNLEHEVIDINTNSVVDSELQYAVVNMCTSSAQSDRVDLNKVQKLLFLQNIDGLIRETLSHTKFKEHSLEWYQLYTNVCISLQKGTITYFRIDDSLKHYVPIIIKQFRKEFMNTDFIQSIFESDEDLLLKTYEFDNNKE